MPLESSSVSTAEAPVADGTALASTGITNEREFSLDEKISLYNSGTAIADQTKSIAAQFSDPESIVRAPRAQVSPVAIETTAPIVSEQAPAVLEKPVDMPEDIARAVEEKKIADELKAVEKVQKIANVKEELYAIYEGRPYVQKIEVASVAPRPVVFAAPEQIVVDKDAQFKKEPDDVLPPVELPPRGGDDDGHNDREGSSRAIEVSAFEKYIGAVVYHREPGQDIRDMKIALVAFGNSWRLPEGSADPKNDEQAETRNMVARQVGASTDIGEKIESSSTSMPDAGGTVTTESSFFIAKAPEETIVAPQGRNVRWFTVAELETDASIGLSRHDGMLISRAVRRIAEQEGGNA